MGRGKPVDLATRSFSNQGLAKQFFSEMMHRYKVGDRVSDLDALDLTSLLERHNEYHQKVGCGVDHFEVMITVHGTPCFRIVRKDGTGTDFSFIHCVTLAAPSRKQEVSQAFRQTIKIELYRRRDRFLSEHRDGDGLIACAQTGERIAFEDGHMDHRPPLTFDVIVTTFLAHQGLSLDDVPLSEGRDEQVAPEITDEAIAKAFAAYHWKVARLDFVKRKVNLGASSKNRLKTARIMPVE
jgi:hypothetical protein